MAGWWFVGFKREGNNDRLAAMQATTSSLGAADTGKLVALNAQGQVDLSMLPPAAQGGVEVRNASNQVIGQASVLRAGDNITIELTGGVARISAVRGDFEAWFEPLLPEDWLGTPIAYTPLL